jgi:hypothetical protein
MQPHGVARLAVSKPPVAPYYPTVAGTEQLTGAERVFAALRNWTRQSAKSCNGLSSQNPFETNRMYFGHHTTLAPELLNGSTSRIAEIHK